MIQIINSFIQYEYQVAFDAVKKVKRTTFKLGDYWLTHTYREGGGISLKTTKEGKPEHESIGIVWDYTQKRLMQLNSRKAKFDVAFGYLLEKRLRNTKPFRCGLVIKIEINERFYWYNSEFNRHGAIIWNKLVWPDMEMIEVKIE